MGPFSFPGLIWDSTRADREDSPLSPSQTFGSRGDALRSSQPLAAGNVSKARKGKWAQGGLPNKHQTMDLGQGPAEDILATAKGMVK